MAKKQNLQNYNVGVTLGTGSFGRVRFATDMETGAPYAIKMLKKVEVVRLEQVEHIQSEKAILAALDFPYIVRMAGTSRPAVFVHGFGIHWAGIFHAPSQERAFRQRHHQIPRVADRHGVRVHSWLDIIYRDLKPENLLLDKAGYLKITGMQVFLDPSPPLPPI